MGSLGLKDLTPALEMFLAVLFANTPLSYLIEQIFLFPPLFVGYFLSLRPSSALRQRLKPVKSVQAGKESVKTNSKVTRQKFELLSSGFNHHSWNDQSPPVQPLHRRDRRIDDRVDYTPGGRIHARLSVAAHNAARWTRDDYRPMSLDQV
jgi:hypothetical protein